MISLEQQEKLIENLQKCLKLIRQAIGWDQAQLGELIGVSRQTINNIENGRSPLSRTQFVALTAIIDAKLEEKPELKTVIHAILDMNKKVGDSIAPFLPIAGGMIGSAFGVINKTTSGSGLLTDWLNTSSKPKYPKE